jgi:hypothetical protein
MGGQFCPLTVTMGRGGVSAPRRTRWVLARPALTATTENAFAVGFAGPPKRNETHKQAERRQLADSSSAYYAQPPTARPSRCNETGRTFQIPKRGAQCSRFRQSAWNFQALRQDTSGWLTHWRPGYGVTPTSPRANSDQPQKTPTNAGCRLSSRSPSRNAQSLFGH